MSSSENPTHFSRLCLSMKLGDPASGPGIRANSGTTKPRKASIAMRPCFNSAWWNMGPQKTTRKMVKKAAPHETMEGTSRTSQTNPVGQSWSPCIQVIKTPSQPITLSDGCPTVSPSQPAQRRLTLHQWVHPRKVCFLLGGWSWYVPRDLSTLCRCPSWVSKLSKQGVLETKLNWHALDIHLTFWFGEKKCLYPFARMPATASKAAVAAVALMAKGVVAPLELAVAGAAPRSAPCAAPVGATGVTKLCAARKAAAPLIAMADLDDMARPMW